MNFNNLLIKVLRKFKIKNGYGSNDLRNTEFHDRKRELFTGNLKNSWRKKHEEVKSLGGLHVIGSERHESRGQCNRKKGFFHEGSPKNGDEVRLTRALVAITVPVQKGLKEPSKGLKRGLIAR